MLLWFPFSLLIHASYLVAFAVAFKSREDHRKQLELEEARKAGLAPAELDEDGKEINPHIPQYMSSAPWYLNAERPSLKHQRKWKSDPNYTKAWYDRVQKYFRRISIERVHVKIITLDWGAWPDHLLLCPYRNSISGSVCQGILWQPLDHLLAYLMLSCGAMTHNAKTCMERPRQKGAKWTSMHIAPDEKIETFELDYDGKRDRWNGYDAATYARNGEEEVSDEEEDDEDDLKVDEAKVDESKQMDFAKVEKRVRTTGGGSTGTVRNLRIREDTAKYLLNLDVNSAHYDPKTRSMREDPLPDADPNEKFYGGDNQYRVSGQALEFKQLNIHAWEAFDKGQDIHMQAAPSQAELLFKNYKVIKEKLKSRMKDTIMDKYGNAAAEEELPRELLLGQSERQVEYDRAGRIIKARIGSLLVSSMAAVLQPASSGSISIKKKVLALWDGLRGGVHHMHMNGIWAEGIPPPSLTSLQEAGLLVLETSLPKSKYEEDVYINNHTCVWGSWWKDHQWGYKCCKQMIRNSYCTGAAGIEAAEAATDLMKTNIARKAATEGGDFSLNMEIPK
ncbi:Pre-mRNA-splicing factor SLU7-A [Vitis vinifera]|uniref:Pre-mRNA-splicing factor SLU7 n=1 Tax=Vitis vinifera TaxID=29760 RepID=A0A438DD27_VITVI|nr:Pre-mRNA-splicing factor SLU7-A [Vitis vinifera]